MESKVLVDTPLLGQTERAAGEVVPACLDIAIDDRSGSIQVRDPRSFHAGRRAFCRRLIEAAARQPGIVKAEIELGSATCRIQFEPGSANARAMADALSAAVAQAATKTQASRTLPWWRSEKQWSSLTAYPVSGDVSLWETLESEPGRIALRHTGAPRDRGRLARVRDSIVRVKGVESCRTCTWSPTLVIQYEPDSPIVPRLFDTLERALRGLDPASFEVPIRMMGRGEQRAGSTPCVTGPRRLLYLGFAGGCFLLTGVGLVVPGVPTVPFLLATSYFLARSSPTLDRRLRATAFFGPILEEWELHEGLSALSKGKLIGLTATIVLVTIGVAQLSTPMVLLIVLVSSVSIIGVIRMPGIEDEPGTNAALTHSARLALPSPGV